MKLPPRRVWLVALLLGLLSIVAVRLAGRNPDPRAGAALTNPCTDPLHWRTGDVDPRFGITRDGFQDAIVAATGVWERATGRDLFRHDPVEGMPVSLVYDQRQADLERRIVRRDRLREMDAAIGRLQDRHNRAATLLSRRLRTYNSDVQRWNRRGGTEAERHRLERERTQIESLRDELDRTASDLRRAVRELEDSIQALGPDRAVRVQTGAFEETLVDRRGRLIRMSPRLTIFQFEDRHELVLILTHELGHALGLGHLPEPDAIMAEEYRSVTPTGDLSLTAADVDALLARCGIAPAAALGSTPR